MLREWQSQEKKVSANKFEILFISKQIAAIIDKISLKFCPNFLKYIVGESFSSSTEKNGKSI